ncbi:DNA-binding protein [Acutalibacter sp.]|uniref:DNA-binding protein n=1 Tax=Acutalibacter sp. TaxID=1918636 RepID=UPI0021716256|nr:DNA-binding protein [Acutalibacter sp.]
MAKDLKISYLLDFYGDMLTQAQYDAVDAYYNQDLSLSEIAADRNISRQGARDAIKRAEQQLLEMEDRLELAKRFQAVQKALAAVCDCALNIQELNSQNGGVPGIDENAGRILALAQEIADKE